MKDIKAQAGTVGSGATVKPSGLLSDIITLWRFLLKGRRLQIAGLLFLMMLSALMEMATLAAAIPLIGALVESQGIGSAALPAPLRNLIEQTGNPQAALFGGVILIVISGALLRILVIRRTADFSARLGLELQVLYLRGLLNRDYEHSINQSSSNKLSLITHKIQVVISSYILGILSAVTAIASSLAVLIMLLYLGTPVVFMALCVLALSYVVIAWFSRARLKHYGRDMQVYIPKKIQCVQESLGAIRDIGMSGSQEAFVQRFAEFTEKTETATARLTFYNAFPRPLLEAIGISTIALIAWISFNGMLAFNNLLPMLGVFALGMLRLLPYAQLIFGQWTRVFNGQRILAELLAEMEDFEEAAPVDPGQTTMAELDFRHNIRFSEVGFAYQGSETPALTGLNLTINKGEFIGIIGPTGSGKSTIVDILMGLLPPTQGQVLIDDVALDAGNRAAWRLRVSHVPQKIYLTEGSVGQNIAFSVPDDNIDWMRVERCAALARIDDYIDSLPQGYRTPVGEDGARLSGGQRQRIGIARALYSRRDVLVFDEATNALDTATEKAVVDGILELEHDYTIIMVAHNLQAVSHCHRILRIGGGTAQWQTE